MTALVVAGVSTYLGWRTWRLSQRPMVSAFLREVHDHADTTEFNLVVANSGIEPATRIRLRASDRELAKILLPAASEDLKSVVRHCFSEEAEVALLRNGEELSTYFGCAGNTNTDSMASLIYGETAAITIVYCDLSGKAWKSQIPLKIYVRRGFGGTVLRVNGEDK